jgi:hypothetical protein
MQLTVTLKPGSTNSEIARELRFQANLIDGIDPKKAASNAMTAAPAAAGKKKPKPVDEDEEETTDDEAEETDEDTESDDAEETDDDEAEEDDAEETDDDEEVDEDEEKPKKKGKAKGPTLKDVNAALKARAEKTSFAKAKIWLKKKFKVESINDVKPAQYAQLIKLAKVISA